MVYPNKNMNSACQEQRTKHGVPGKNESGMIFLLDRRGHADQSRLQGMVVGNVSESLH